MRPATVEPFALLQEALEVYRAHFAVLFPLALIVGLIQAILTIGLGGGSADEINDGQLVATIVGLLPALVFLAVSVELLRDVRGSGEVRSTGDLVRSVLPILLPLLTVALLAAIGTVAGLFLLIVPGLILATIWAVVLPVYVIERPGIAATFGRSRELVRGHGMPVFGTLLLVLVVALLGAIVATVIAVDPASAVGSFVQLAITSLVTPVTTLVLAGLYFQLVALQGPAAPASPRDAAEDAFGRRD